MPQHHISVRGKPIPPDFVAFDAANLERPFGWHVEQHARNHPERLALKAGTRCVTYGELNAAANRLAHFILRAPPSGCAPIALLMPQGAAALTTMLACLKAGVMYAALDPAMPPARLRGLLDHTLSRWLWCDRERLTLGRAVAGEDCVVMDWEAIRSGRDRDARDNPAPRITPDTPACITYTSGSTGQPKGVVHTHGSILVQAHRSINYFAIAPSDRLHWSRPPSVLSLLEFFAPLVAGASLFPFEIRTESPSALAQLHTEAGITISGLIATPFRHWAGALTGGGHFPSLRFVAIGGEAAYRSDVKLFRSRFAPGCLLAPGWGVTEAGGNLTRTLYDHESLLPESRLPAGYPYEGVELLILDNEGDPVARGEAGEIAVRSLYLPAGYWRQPELTRERFKPWPDTDGRGGRIFLTGDLGRLQPDGCLIHLGRKDQQVKVRGYRVEPAEVERALAATPGVRQALVMLRPDPPAEDRLVAYIVPAAQPPPTASELRRPLAAALPDYMVPSAFVFMDAFPLSANSKVNRSLLPAPGRARPALDTCFVPPRTPVEQTLARIWREVLGLDEIGAEDSFLDLGGHSLQAARIIARVLGAFQVDLELGALFDAPTVGAMAMLITVRGAQQLGPERLDKLLHELEASQ